MDTLKEKLTTIPLLYKFYINLANSWGIIILGIDASLLR
jgi:hypothetical protein